MNIRKHLYFLLLRLRGQTTGMHYRQFIREDRQGIPTDTRRKLLIRLLDHSKAHVPYYREVMAKLGDDYRDDPEAYLRKMPILTKSALRQNLEQLKSDDLDTRRWFPMTSGGSTGEPVTVIQDWESDSWICAVSMVYSKLAGREVGEKEVMIWGSLRDIVEGTAGWKPRLIHWLNNTIFLNSFHMSREQMREYINTVNTRRPKQITCYSNTLYELARFAEEENLPITAHAPIISSAGTFYPFMRETVERAFQARVYNRYGSRETGDVACERPDMQGLWVAPWGNYIEIVDASGNPVPDGQEGSILVTCLGNRAMPLIRYQIGDRGILSPKRAGRYQQEQVFERVIGRTVDMIYNSKGDVVDDGFLLGLMDFKDWVKQYQLIQKSLTCIEYRVVRANNNYTQEELDGILKQAREIMGEDTEIYFNFVDEIPETGTSGKFRYVLSEIAKQAWDDCQWEPTPAAGDSQ